MTRLSIQVHRADSYNKMVRTFFTFDDGNLLGASTSMILIQDGDDKLVSDLRAAADELEVTLAKDKKKAEIEARVKELMEAEA